MTITDAPSAAPSPAELDADLAELRAGSARWAALSLVERARLLVDACTATGRVAREWADAAATAKGVDPGSSLAGEEWLTGPYGTLDALDAYATSLIGLARHGTTLTGARFVRAPGGRIAVRVLPEGLQQWVLFHGFQADVWMRPGTTEADVRAAAGLGARTPGQDGGVALILGAGNITSIGPLDLLYELVAHNRAGLLKLNPTFDALLPVYRAAFAPLVELGVARIVTGDGAVGAYLTQHDGVDKVHITGSAATHDRIVWGDGEEAARRRAAGEPRLAKPITSELGGVAPVIVVPGRWSRADLRYQAQHVATMRLHNAGHNCIAAQDLVVSGDWEQKDAFLAELRAVLREIAPRAPWYPGSAAKVAAARADHAGALELGDRLLVDAAAGSGDELFRTEYFAPVLGVTELPGTGLDFLRRAVAFANDELEGTLGANVLIAPAERRALGSAFGDAIAELRYGTIAVNAWTGVGFGFARGVWGGFPGHTLEDVGSGIGVVHNAHLLADPERMVVTGPFRPFPRSIAGGELALFPTPPWFVTNRGALETARRLTAYAAAPSWGRLLRTLLAAFRRP
ncbi:MAG: aldehyde dehydrogenase family protein [Microbacteriaceae bacterium]|nr:aldehyde dehydrogenase family protein [Microbacteriaceae bacterium]